VPTNKLGLFLLPLVPLSALGIVEIANSIGEPDAPVCVQEARRVEPPQFSKPPAKTPEPPAPQPTVRL
jgi:hypothetical protein